MDKGNHILIVNQSSVAPDRGGYTRQFSFAKEFVKQGYEVTIVASSLDHFARHNYKDTSPKQHVVGSYDGVRFVWLHETPRSASLVGRLMGMFEFLRRTLLGGWRKEVPQPDVVIASSPNLVAALGGLLLAKRLRVPFVFEVRDIWPQTLIDLGGLSPRHPGIAFLALIEKVLYQQADQIVALMPLAKDHIVSKGADGSKVTWIPNGVDFSMLPPPEESPPTKHGPLQIVYAGAHGLANALDPIIDAAALLEEKAGGERYRFTFIGEGIEKERLKARVKTMGLASVEFVDAVPKAEIYHHLQEADLLIVNMLQGGLYRFGTSLNKMYDYMAASKPIVFGTSSAKNPVEESGAGITVAPSDAEELARAVEQLAAMSPAEREAMGRRGYEYAREHHDFEKLAVRFAEAVEAARTKHQAS